VQVYRTQQFEIFRTLRNNLVWLTAEPCTQPSIPHNTHYVGPNSYTTIWMWMRAEHETTEHIIEHCFNNQSTLNYSNLITTTNNKYVPQITVHLQQTRLFHQGAPTTIQLNIVEIFVNKSNTNYILYCHKRYIPQYNMKKRSILFHRCVFATDN
jgi:hypothetical protein